MRAPITPRLLLKRPKKPLYVWDIHHKGLGVRLTASGYSFQIQVGGHRRSLGQISLKEALGAFQATTLPGALLPAAGGASRAWETYIQERGAPSRYWRELDARFRKHVLPCLELTKQGIRDALATKADYPVAQRTLWEGLSPFLKWLVANDYLPSNPMPDLIPPRVPAQRDRVLTDMELRAIWCSCAVMPLWGDFYRLLILTAQRRNEVAGIQYSEVLGNLWTIPGERTKNGKTHLVHLSSAAMELISSKPLFIGRGVSGYSKAKRKLDTLSGIDNYRIHDFRRTAATGMQRLGVEPHVVELILNHTNGSVYQRFEYLEARRAALELWAAHLKDIL